MAIVKANDTVKVHYTGETTKGDIFDTTMGADPADFPLGQGLLLPHFEEALVGMSVGEKKTFQIGSNDAYGPVNEEFFYEVPKNVLPEDIELQVGGQLTARNDAGEERPVIIAQINEETIVVDGNHPLAGQDLVFHVEVVGIVE